MLKMEEAKIVETHVTSDSPIYIEQKQNEIAKAEAEKQANVAANAKTENTDENFYRGKVDINDKNNIVEIPATTLVYAHLKMPVNSDYNDFVYAEIVGGPLDGAKLMGTANVPFIDVVYMPRDKLKITFTSMVYKRETIPIEAVAIDHEEASTYMSSSVDYHYFQRWGGVVGGVMLQMLGSNYLDSQEERQAEALKDIYGNTIVTNNLGDNTINATKEGFKAINENISDIALQQFNRPPTVTKEGGMIGVFFKKEVNDDRVPVLFNNN